MSRRSDSAVLAKSSLSPARKTPRLVSGSRRVGEPLGSVLALPRRAPRARRNAHGPTRRQANSRGTVKGRESWITVRTSVRQTVPERTGSPRPSGRPRARHAGSPAPVHRVRREEATGTHRGLRRQEARSAFWSVPLGTGRAPGVTGAPVHRSAGVTAPGGLVDETSGFQLDGRRLPRAFASRKN